MNYTASSSDGWTATVDADNDRQAWHEAVNRHGRWALNVAGSDILAEITVTPEPRLLSVATVEAPEPQAALW